MKISLPGPRTGSKTDPNAGPRTAAAVPVTSTTTAAHVEASTATISSTMTAAVRDAVAARHTTGANPAERLAHVAAGLAALPVLDDAATALTSPLLHRERAKLGGLRCADELHALLARGDVRVGDTGDPSRLGRLVSLDRQLRLVVSPAVLAMDAHDPLLAAALVRALAAAKLARAETAYNGSDAWSMRATGLLVGEALVRHLGLVDGSAPAVPTPPAGPVYYPAAGTDAAAVDAARAMFPSTTKAVCADLCYAGDIETRDATGSGQAPFQTQWRKRDLVQEPLREPVSVVWMRAPGDFATLMYVPKFVAACIEPLVVGGVGVTDGSWAAKPLMLHLPLSTIGFAPGPLVERHGSVVDTATKTRAVSPEHLRAALDLDRALDAFAAGPSPFYLPELQDDGSLMKRALVASTPDEQRAVVRALRRTALALGGRELCDVVDDVLTRAVERRQGKRNELDAAVAAEIGGTPHAGLAADVVTPQASPEPAAFVSRALTFDDVKTAAETLGSTHAWPVSAFDSAVAALSDGERATHEADLAAMRAVLVAKDVAEVRALLAHGLVDDAGHLRTAPHAARNLSRALEGLVASGLATEADIVTGLGRLAEQALANISPALARTGVNTFKPTTDPRDPIVRAVLQAAIDRGVLDSAVVDARMAAARDS